MKKITLLFVLLHLNAFAQSYITNVTVVDVERQRLIPNQTVTIVGDLISDIKPANTKIPSNAVVIDAKGKFLLPGLTDAHIHFFQSGGLYTRPDAIDLRKIKPYEKEIEKVHNRMENVLKRYLRNGITTVVDVGATYNFLKQRQNFATTELAPSIYMTGPLLTTYQPEAFAGLKDDAPFQLVATPEEARKMVREQLTHQPDLIKIWYIVNVDNLDTEAGARKYLPVVKAIIDEAHQNKKKVAVHATERITAQLAVENGCDFLVHSIEDELLTDDFIKLLKKKNVVLCPTLVVYDGYEDTFGQKLNLSDHELRMADPFQLGSLLDLKHLADTLLVNAYRKYTIADKQVAKVLQTNNICIQNLKKLSDAGVTIATGTDAGNIGTLHASSYLDELLRMRQAGLSNWKIIEASTINGAKALGKENEFGSIAKGKKANLILLDANPVENIENLTKIHRVINKGVFLDPDKLLLETPEELVQRQLNAYNFRNLEAFLDTYADDVEVYDFPEKLQYKGKETMRKIYGGMFSKVPNLHCEILGRVVTGNFVIDKERVQINKEIIEGTAIYQIEDEKIKKVYFMPMAD
ncbi:MAG TPA: amidohydrolase family protein [Flavobacterium sp.]|jgi:imidazolonepropionase-like amidohydrolase